jgi:hypothetical protein
MARLRPFLIVMLGLAVGIGLGLYLGWVAWPTSFTDAAPSILQESYRQDYVRMIAAAYAADNDLPAAQKRVADLGPDGRDLLLSVTLDTILQGQDEAEIRRLVQLAVAMGLTSPAMTPYLPENGAGAAP